MRDRRQFENSNIGRPSLSDVRRIRENKVDRVEHPDCFQGPNSGTLLHERGKDLYLHSPPLAVSLAIPSDLLGKLGRRTWSLPSCVSCRDGRKEAEERRDCSGVCGDVLDHATPPRSRTFSNLTLTGPNWVSTLMNWFVEKVFRQRKGDFVRYAIGASGRSLNQFDVRRGVHFNAAAVTPGADFLQDRPIELHTRRVDTYDVAALKHQHNYAVVDCRHVTKVKSIKRHFHLHLDPPSRW